VEDLIKGLCEKDPTSRLPMKKGGTSNIKQHPWYAKFDWPNMEKGLCDAPYKPAVKGKTDHSNFNAHKEDMPPVLPYKDPGTGWDKDFATC